MGLLTLRVRNRKLGVLITKKASLHLLCEVELVMWTGPDAGLTLPLLAPRSRLGGRGVGRLHFPSPARRGHGRSGLSHFHPCFPQVSSPGGTKEKGPGQCGMSRGHSHSCFSEAQVQSSGFNATFKSSPREVGKPHFLDLSRLSGSALKGLLGVLVFI